MESSPRLHDVFRVESDNVINNFARAVQCGKRQVAGQDAADRCYGVGAKISVVVGIGVVHDALNGELRGHAAGLVLLDFLAEPVVGAAAGNTAGNGVAKPARRGSTLSELRPAPYGWCEFDVALYAVRTLYAINKDFALAQTDGAFVVFQSLNLLIWS